MNKVYLGDAVYAEYIDGMVCLTVEYGQGSEQQIYLDPIVMQALIKYWSEVR